MTATNAQVTIVHYTDPACPFAFSLEPGRLRLRWRYGGQLGWKNRLIVLTREPGEAEKLAGGAAGLQRLHGMPIQPGRTPGRPPRSPLAGRSSPRAFTRRTRKRGCFGGCASGQWQAASSTTPT